MLKFLSIIIACLCLQFAYANESAPKYLYKVVTVEAWQDSQKQQSVELPAADDEFIHFSKEDQLERITSKYWANAPYVVLKVDASKLPGKLVYEVNPGGTAKYYHLYDGSIPLDAVVEAKVVNVPGAKS